MASCLIVDFSRTTLLLRTSPFGLIKNLESNLPSRFTSVFKASLKQAVSFGLADLMTVRTSLWYEGGIVLDAHPANARFIRIKVKNFKNHPWDQFVPRVRIRFLVYSTICKIYQEGSIGLEGLARIYLVGGICDQKNSFG